MNTAPNTSLISHLDRALAATGVVVTGIREDQWDLPTPCRDWNVRTLGNHLVGGLRIFTAQLRGEADPGGHDTHDWLGAQPAAAYADAATADRAAWRTAGAMDTVLDLAFGRVPAPLALVVHLTEVVVHGLDLAVATGQEEKVDGAPATHLLELVRTSGVEAYRVPGIFGPEQPVEATAPVHRRLLAYLGRELDPVTQPAL